MSLISLREVHFRWSNHALLDGIQLDIHKGDRIGLLGSNGAGKSTLMQMLTGNLAPSAGSVTVGGVGLLQKPRDARAVVG